MMTEEQKRDVFPKYAQLVCEPKNWLSIARSLYAAAGKLEPEINRLWKDMLDSMFTPGYIGDPGPFMAAHYQRVYLMLIAFTLENVIKGFLVGTSRPQMLAEASKNGFLPSLLKTHDLRKLVEMCPLDLSPDDRSLLHRLTAHAEWIGRYPYPTKAEEFYTFSDSSSIPGNAIGWSSDELKRIKELVDNIAEQLGTSVHPERGGTPA